MTQSVNAVEHLRRRDPVLRRLIEQLGPDLGDPRVGRPEDHFGALLRAIVGQQLSTVAARAIFSRLLARYGGRTPTPAEVLAEDPDELRSSVGLSRAKTRYVRSLAEHVDTGTLGLARLDELDELDDAAVIAELTAVTGIGRWSAEIFLMFHLARPDVLPVGDLGIRKAVRLHYGLAELPAPDVMEAIAEPWRPERTLGCRYLWRSLDVTPA